MSLSYVSIDWGGTHLNGAVIRDMETIQEFELPAGNLKILSEEDILFSLTLRESWLCTISFPYLTRW